MTQKKSNKDSSSKVKSAGKKSSKSAEEFKDNAEHTISEAELGHKPAPVAALKFSSKITTLKDSTQQAADGEKQILHDPSKATVENLTPEQLAQLKVHQARQGQQPPKLGAQAAAAPGLLPRIFEKLVHWADVTINYMTVAKNDPKRTEVLNYTRSSAVFGIWVTIITLFVFFVWGGYAPINKAAVATGSLVLESQKRIIQHPYGGIIDKIHVKEGDHVIKGQTLISLNKVDVQSQHDDTFNKYMTMLAEHARLVAQRDGADKITFPDELLAHAGKDKVSKIMHSQERIFIARNNTIDSKVNAENNKVQQAMHNKKAYTDILEMLDKKIENFKTDLAAYKKVHNSGGSSPAQIRQAENQIGQALNEKIDTISKIAQFDEEIAREQSTILAIKSEYLQEAAKELRANMQDLVTTKEHYNQTEDRLVRSEIKSPVTGQVSNLQKIYTDGGYIQQVQPIMEIIPQNDSLVADVRITANDIDIVRKGQTALVMITPFKNRVVPKVKGTITLISPDVIMPQPGQDPNPYYHARIEMDPKELEDVRNTKGVELYPGMPVQAFIEIGPRTLLRYLLDPFLMSFDRAFREE